MYSKPTLIKLGSFERLTMALFHGRYLDGYPSGHRKTRPPN